MITLIGSNGSMGKRYQAILRFLKKDFMAFDADANPEVVKKAVKNSAGVIIATPTDTHEAMIREHMTAKVPILCEKPVCKDQKALMQLLRDLERTGTPFRMMFQYSLLNDSNRIGKTRFDYYNTGKDGIYWDCIQIIGLARKEIQVFNKSPIWSCQLNGKFINFAHMDAAYIGYVQRWFAQPDQDFGVIRSVHEKVHAYIEAQVGDTCLTSA